MIRWDLAALALALVLVLPAVGCGTTVDSGSELTVYVSAPLRGTDGPDGAAIAAGATRALEDAAGEAGGAPVQLEVLDDAERLPARAGGAGWTQAQVAANARTATEDSTAIAYIGELQSDATRVSAAITNEAGVLQISPGPVDPDLLTTPGGNDVPEEFQPTGERTLGALFTPASFESGRYRDYGYEAMALVLDSIDRAEDPLSRADVVAAFLATTDRQSRLGTYTVDPTGLAGFAGT
jgi:hypothetical protein